MENVYSDALDALLRDRCTVSVVRESEAGGDAAPLWQVLEESGFADSLLPDAGLSLGDVLPMLVTMGYYALPLPLAQTMFARALLHAGGVPVPAGPMALAVDDGAGGVRVADGATAAWFLLQRGDRVHLVSREAAGVTPTGVHGDLAVNLAANVAPRSTSAFALPAGTLRTIGAALHAAQMAGAMARVFALTLQYANDRAQFGRNIGKFQAIQHQISVMAEQVAATRMAAQIGGAAAQGWLPDPMQAAIAKFNASEAVTPVTSIAHAVHGAIGVTAEYDLQVFTRRLHAWRMADGSERYWAREIGAQACAAEGGAVDLIRHWGGEAA